MPLILGANSVSGGYNVANSLRFNSGSSDSLTRTTGTPTSQQKFTWSSWCKRTNIGTYNIIQGFYTNANNYLLVGFSTSDKIDIINYPNSTTARKITTQVFRDPSAWYHILVAVDTTLATATDRIKLYVNGNQVTAFTTDTAPSQNANLLTNATTTAIGVGEGGSIGYYNGYISEIYYIDGQALDPTYFGETDFDSGIWKPIPYTGSFGTNGFYLEFQNSGSLGLDSSGNANNFTVNNLTSIDQTTDTCTNNFSTMNPLMIPTSNAGTFTEGNLSVQSASSGFFGGGSTLGVSKGKWYWEGKITAQTAVCGHLGIDGDPSESARLNYYAGQASWSYGINGGSGNKFNNNSDSAYGGTFTLNDILMIAMDLDNNYVYFGINGTWQNSGVPTSGASGTGSAFSISTSPPSGNYFIVTGDGSGGNNATFASNFGNPPFTISSGNADAEGFGNFEYAVPSGYFALCSKNLAEYA